MSKPFRDAADRLAAHATDDALQEVVQWAADKTVTDEEVAHLANRLAQSGLILDLSDYGRTADIASTGGPSSLSTLICPLHLCELGYVVPKLTVPGRPAGSIDVLAQLPGYVVQLTEADVPRVISEARFAHFVASDTFAPLDARLFSYRRLSGVVDSPILAIASILAKKIAAGVEAIGLEVRVAPRGGFGSTWNSARENARRFCRAAAHLGRKAICFLTDGRFPYQPFIGRGEALLGLASLLEDHAPRGLEEHLLSCYNMALGLARSQGDHVLHGQLAATRIRACFERHLRAQGTTVSAFERQAAMVRAMHENRVLMLGDGYLDVDLALLRRLIVRRQARLISAETPFPDPCGVILMKMPGECVSAGDPVASVRVKNGEATAFAAEVTSAFRGTSAPRKRRPMEEITDA